MDQLSSQVLGAAFEVQNTLGAGFLEKVYERALLRELDLREIPAKSQPSIEVRYKGHPIGHYQPDILAGNELLIELKCADHLAPEHTAQCLNYLKATNLRICLLINFQKPRLEWKRLINAHFLPECI